MSEKMYSTLDQIEPNMEKLGNMKKTWNSNVAG